MNKKIKITVKDPEKLEFFISESANKDDYICIKDIMNINVEDVKSFFDEKKIKNHLKNLRNKSDLKKRKIEKMSSNLVKNINN